MAAAWAVGRRRVPADASPPEPAASPGSPPARRWVSAGEGRAVAAIAAERVRARVARLVPEADRALDTEQCIAVLEARRPDWPLRDLSELLRGLDRARFAPAVPSEALHLVEQVDALLRDLGEGRT